MVEVKNVTNNTCKCGHEEGWHTGTKRKGKCMWQKDLGKIYCKCKKFEADPPGEEVPKEVVDKFIKKGLKKFEAIEEFKPIGTGDPHFRYVEQKGCGETAIIRFGEKGEEILFGVCGEKGLLCPKCKPSSVCVNCGFEEEEHYHLKDGVFCITKEKVMNRRGVKFKPQNDVFILQKEHLERTQNHSPEEIGENHIKTENTSGTNSQHDLGCFKSNGKDCSLCKETKTGTFNLSEKMRILIKRERGFFHCDQCRETYWELHKEFIQRLFKVVDKEIGLETTKGRRITNGFNKLSGNLWRINNG